MPAILVAGAATSASVGGAVIYDKRSLKTMNQDHYAHSLAQHQLDTDPLFKDHAHINVAIFNATALLVGQAQTADIRDHAYQVISKIPNVARVYNEITVSAPTSPVQRANDSWITTKVRTMMLGKSGLNSTNFKVITENGVVYLMGIVSQQQAAIAVDTARRVSGVNKVVKVFSYD